jgi:hypothetical protein
MTRIDWPIMIRNCTKIHQCFISLVLNDNSWWYLNRSVTRIALLLNENRFKWRIKHFDRLIIRVCLDAQQSWWQFVQFHLLFSSRTECEINHSKEIEW